jgi:thioredoxin 1
LRFNGAFTLPSLDIEGESMADAALHLTEATFDTELGKRQEVVMVDFWAEWCGPCRQIAPTLEQLAQESAGKVSLAKVNVDEHPSLAARYGIRSIPTILLMRNGKVVDQVVGAVPKAQLKKKLDAIA